MGRLKTAGRVRNVQFVRAGGMAGQMGRDLAREAMKVAFIHAGMDKEALLAAGAGQKVLNFGRKLLGKAKSAPRSAPSIPKAVPYSTPKPQQWAHVPADAPRMTGGATTTMVAPPSGGQTMFQAPAQWPQPQQRGRAPRSMSQDPTLSQLVAPEARWNPATAQRATPRSSGRGREGLRRPESVPWGGESPPARASGGQVKKPASRSQLRRPESVTFDTPAPAGQVRPSPSASAPPPPSTRRRGSVEAPATKRSPGQPSGKVRRAGTAGGSPYRQQGGVPATQPQPTAPATVPQQPQVSPPVPGPRLAPPTGTVAPPPTQRASATSAGAVQPSAAGALPALRTPASQPLPRFGEGDAVIGGKATTVGGAPVPAATPTPIQAPVAAPEAAPGLWQKAKPYVIGGGALGALGIYGAGSTMSSLANTGLQALGGHPGMYPAQVGAALPAEPSQYGYVGGPMLM